MNRPITQPLPVLRAVNPFTPLEKYLLQFGPTWSPDFSLVADFQSRPWWVRELFLVTAHAEVKRGELVDAFGIMDALETAHLQAPIR